MKFLMLLVLGLSLVSAALLARDLTSVARREKQRRAANGRVVLSFDNGDLERYRDGGGDARVDVPSRRLMPSFGKRKDRDLEKEQQYWRREALRHERELARLDASIRRLEWRVNSWRRRRPRPGERIFDDPTSNMLEESLKALREQRRRTEERFLERARKAGAFPGWLR
ncbi:MAG TPA: hypothetical protein VLK65_26855 [Vicinamibacteria bacterium]|nr:hypothetical protein [Vicinamibacteria bacterium]